MKTLDQQMAVYAAYHRNRWNRLTHFIGVPAIIFAILIPMSWVSLGEDLSLAHVFLGAVLAYYFLLDVPLALATAVEQKVVRENRAQKHRSEEHTSELQSRSDLVCRLLLEKK